MVIDMRKPARPKPVNPIDPRRNSALLDNWSVVHVATGILMGWCVQPFIALSVMVLWEPLEILVLSPLLARRGVKFGYESLRNSLSDIFFDVIGVALGAWLLANLVSPPFRLF
jgi:hypothetical protein